MAGCGASQRGSNGCAQVPGITPVSCSGCARVCHMVSQRLSQGQPTSAPSCHTDRCFRCWAHSCPGPQGFCHWLVGRRSDGPRMVSRWSLDATRMVPGCSQDAPRMLPGWSPDAGHAACMVPSERPSARLCHWWPKATRLLTLCLS